MNKKQYFELCDENVKKIVNSVSKQDNDVQLSYYKSATTNSFYVIIIYNGYRRCVRISDHGNSKNNQKTIIVYRSTKNSKIINAIKSTIKDMKVIIKKETFNDVFSKINIDK